MASAIHSRVMFKLHFNPWQALQQWVQQKSVAKRSANNNTYTRDSHDARNVTVNSVPLTSSEFHADRELSRGASNVATESELVPPPCLSLRAKNSGPELRMPQRHPRARESLRYWGSAIPVAAASEKDTAWELVWQLPWSRNTKHAVHLKERRMRIRID